jgi:hypothetical protein
MTEDAAVLVPVTKRVLAALGRVPKTATIGDDSDALVLQAFWATARAIVDPLPAAPGTAVELPLAQPRARIASPTSRARRG